MTPKPTPTENEERTKPINNDEEIVSKEFLTQVLTEELKHGSKNSTPPEIVSYSVQLGTKPGDNFMSLIYSIDLELKNSAKKRHWIMKCYPTHPQRQEYNNKNNMFFKEMEVYSKWIPELRRFQREVVGLEKHQVFRLPYAHFVYGKCVDFESAEGNLKTGQLLHSLDNIIIMEDIRKTHGFQMANRCGTLDLDHMTLVFTTLATVHALSWAYRHHVEKDLVGKFSCLTALYANDIGTVIEIVRNNLIQQQEIFDKEFGPGNPFSQAAEKIKEQSDIIWRVFLGNEDGHVLEKFLRVYPIPEKFGKDAENPEPWRIICHGDCWSNNFLFHYDPTTNKPVEVVLVDLQMVEETCVVNDLQYVVYTCTDSELRRNHLDDLLKLYHDKFNSVCKTMKSPTLPGFNVESLKYRFHRTKSVGYLMAAIMLPIVLKQEDEAVNIQNMDENKDMTDVFKDIIGDNSGNEIFKRRIKDVITEMIDDGVM